MKFTITFEERKPAGQVEVTATGDMRAHQVVPTRADAVGCVEHWLSDWIYDLGDYCQARKSRRLGDTE